MRVIWPPIYNISSGNSFLPSIAGNFKRATRNYSNMNRFLIMLVFFQHIISKHKIINSAG